MCNSTRRLGDGYRVILRQRVRGSVRAVRAVRNTRVFLTETRVTADEVNLPSPLWQMNVPIRHVISPISGHSNPIRQVVHLIFHIRSYPPHHVHLHPPSLSFSSTTLPSSQNPKSSHHSLSLCHDHELTPSSAYTKYNIHRVQHTPCTAYTKYKYTPSTAYTKYSIHPRLFVFPSFS